MLVCAHAGAHARSPSPPPPRPPRSYSARVELSSKVLDSFSKLQRTLCHELCHVAAWLVDHTAKPPHGPVFRRWAEAAMARYPHLDITTCHAYEIFYPFRCMGLLGVGKGSPAGAWLMRCAATRTWAPPCAWRHGRLGRRSPRLVVQHAAEAAPGWDAQQCPGPRSSTNPAQAHPSWPPHPPTPRRWQCSNSGCLQTYGRHSNSIDVAKKVCGACRAPLTFLGRFRPDGTPAKPRAASPNKYAQFVKENHAEGEPCDAAPIRCRILLLPPALPPTAPARHLLCDSACLLCC